MNLKRMTEEERQRVMDELHADGVLPTVLSGSGSPAHVASLAANLNDLRQFVSIEATNSNKMFTLIGYRPKPEPEETNDKSEPE